MRHAYTLWQTRAVHLVRTVWHSLDVNLHYATIVCRVLDVTSAVQVCTRLAIEAHVATSKSHRYLVRAEPKLCCYSGPLDHKPSNLVYCMASVGGTNWLCSSSWWHNSFCIPCDALCPTLDQASGVDFRLQTLRTTPLWLGPNVP